MILPAIFTACPNNQHEQPTRTTNHKFSFSATKPSPLHYIDPSYVSESRAYGYKAVYRHEMTDEQHVAMLDEVKKLKGRVIISGYENEI